MATSTAASKRKRGQSCVKRPASKEEKVPLPPQVFVISLARRPDRWQELQQNWESCLKKGLQLRRFEAVDGAEEAAAIPTEDVALEWSTHKNRRYVSKVFEGGEDYADCRLPLSAGERGCAASHIKLWRQLAREEGPCIVLEDDALPVPSFLSRLSRLLKSFQKLGAPDLCYLGYTQAAPWRSAVSQGLQQVEYCWTTVGYLLWPSGCQKLLEALPVDQPVDNFIADLTSSNRLEAWAVDPPMVSQAKPWNEDSDVLHSDEAAWQG